MTDSLLTSMVCSKDQCHYHTIGTTSLTLSCTIAKTGKSCFSVRKMRFAVAITARQGGVWCFLLCQMVKVVTQNRLFSTAK